MTGARKGKPTPVTAQTPEGEVKSLGVGEVAFSRSEEPRPPVHDHLRNYRPGPDVRHLLADSVLADYIERWAS